MDEKSIRNEILYRSFDFRDERGGEKGINKEVKELLQTYIFGAILGSFGCNLGRFEPISTFLGLSTAFLRTKKRKEKKRKGNKKEKEPPPQSPPPERGGGRRRREGGDFGEKGKC